MAIAGVERHGLCMLIPVVSVSLIGLAVALRRGTSAVGRGPLAGAGLVGAWVGFLLGSIAGGVVEAVVIGGFWAGLAGHVGAFALARLAVSNRTRLAVPSRT